MMIQRLNYQIYKMLVEKAGYKVLVETTNKTLKIEGMTCACLCKEYRESN